MAFESGKRILVTFNLRHKTCTVRDIFKAISIDTKDHDNVLCIPAPSPSIDYMVYVSLTIKCTPIHFK